MYSQITANKRKTFVLLGGFLLIIGGLAWIFAQYFGGTPNVTIGILIGAVIYMFISYFTASRLALSLNSAKEIAKRDNPRLWRIVENLAIAEGLPTPKIYIIDDPAPNAFATGRDPNHAIVGVTTGLLELMDDQELEGVIAHELGHVKNYDIRVSLMAFALVAVVGLLADIMLRMVWFRGDDDNNSGNQLFLVLGIVAAILAPMVATIIQLAISRRREFLADATGALTTRYPEGLASALAKLGRTGTVLKKQNTSTAHLFFANPLKKRSLAGLFDTHPPLEERIARLREMENHT